MTEKKLDSEEAPASAESAGEVSSGFHERLRKLVGDEPPYAWSRRIGIQKGTMDGLWNGRAMPQTKTLLKIDRHTNVSLSWLLSGKGPERIDARTVVAQSERTYAVAVTEPAGHADGYADGRYVYVPRYDVDVGAGDGRSVPSEQVVDHLAFRADWIFQVMGLDPWHLALVSVRGDSMEPTLKEGDLVLLDRREQKARNDAIYVLRLDDELIAKRLQRGFDGSLTIQSDNPAYERQVLSAEQVDRLKIVGRVIWTGRKL